MRPLFDWQERAAAAWRVVAGVLAGLALLLAVLIGAFRLAIELLPGYQQRIVEQVQEATGLRLQFDALDARIGLYGPEIYFQGARILAPGGEEPLISARAGRASLAIARSMFWRRIEVSRIVLESPQLNFLIHEDGATELVGQSAIPRRAPGEREPLTLDRIPRGLVVVRNATLKVLDLRSSQPPFTLSGANLEIERGSAAVTLEGNVRLPRRLGEALEVEARLEGDLRDPDGLEWQAGIEARQLAFEGWSELLPETLPVPVGGRGDLRASLRGSGRAWQSARLRMELTEFALPGVAEPFLRVAGDIRLRRADGRVDFEASGIELSGVDLPWRPGRLVGAIEHQEGRLGKVLVQADYLRLENLVLLAPLLPEGRARRLVMALKPRGEVVNTDLIITPVGAGRLPDIHGSLRFRGLGFEPYGRAPGADGLSGALQGQGDTGALQLAVRDATLRWPMRFRADNPIASLDGRLEWSRVSFGVRLAMDDGHFDTGHGSARGRLRMLLRPGRTPLMDLQAQVSGVDLTQAWRWLPTDKMSDRALAWLDAAFRGGRMSQGRVEITGPVRGFPYREGQGRFHAEAEVEDLRLFYAQGWPELSGVRATVAFDGPGFRATATRGMAGGIALELADASSADLRAAIVGIRATAATDLKAALGFVHNSPLQASLGRSLAGVEGGGPITGDIALYLPIKQPERRSVTVQMRFAGVSAGLAGQPGIVSKLSGSLWVRNREVQAPSLRGEFIGGPGEIRVTTTPGPGGSLLTRAEGSGTLDGTALRSLARLPSNGGVNGTAAWRGSLQLDRPADAALPARGRLQLDSDLRGLASGLPEPLAKSAEESLPLSINADFGGLAAPQVRARLGRNVNALLQWRRDPRDPPVEHGVVLFGGATPERLPAARGLWLGGRLESASLSDLARLQWDQPTGRALHEWLGGADLGIGRFEALGHEFRDVSGVLRPGHRAWEVELAAPQIRGRLVVPHGFPGEVPLVADLNHLTLGARLRPSESDSDPRKLPAIQFDIRELLVDGRQLGHARGELARGTAGLTLNRLSLEHAAYSATGQGSWLVQDGQAHCRLEFELSSGNLRGLMQAMNLGSQLAGKQARVSARLDWPGGPDGDFMERLNGQLRIEADDGQLTSVEPGAGRVLGLMSLAHLPRRLALDFGDLTGEGLAFDTIRGDFILRDGEASTSNLTLRGAAAEIGVAGSTSLRNRTYDQTAVVTGQLGASLGVAGALAGGPVVGAALLLFSQIFKEPLKGATRGYYRITGSWDEPQVKRIDAREMREARPAPAPEPAP